MLLAACGSDEAAEDSAAPATEATVAAVEAGEGAASTESLPRVPANALETIAFPGTYTREENGEVTRLTLRDDDTYEYVAGSGEPRTGRYTRMPDGSRIMIEDFDGRAGYFSVADGALYRLVDETTPFDAITVTGQYRREIAPVQESGPSATTDSVADKRR